MAKLKVLFVCVRNSARSLMAEACLKRWAGDRFDVSSAGLSPREVNPLVAEIMQDWEIDLAGHHGRSVFELFKEGRLYDIVISVCDESSAERCPVFPGITQRLHWSFEDPTRFEGTQEEKLLKTRNLRDRIDLKIKEWVDAMGEADAKA